MDPVEWAIKIGTQLKFVNETNGNKKKVPKC